jgi:LacI family transcriptional regulator
MINLTEIAKIAGVSRGTVDRVIHKRGKVASDKEKKIKEVLALLDYKPNIYARGLSLSKTFQIGVLLPDTSNNVQYWDLPYSGIKKAEDELASYRVKIKSYRYNNITEESFQTACNKLLKEIDTLDGLVVAPVLWSATREFLMNNVFNIPIVVIESMLPSINSLCYVGSNPLKSGLLAGRLFSLFVDKKPGKIVVIRELPENYNINNRVEGFLVYMKNFGDIELKLVGANRRENKEIFKQRTKELITNDNKIDGIFVPSASVGEVAEIVKEEGKGSKIKIIGFDPTEDNIKFLKDGTIDILISQRSDLMGYRGIHTLYKKIVLNEKVPKEIFTPMDILIKENVEFYNNY